jgi:hypothetical protein
VKVAVVVAVVDLVDLAAHQPVDRLALDLPWDLAVVRLWIH